MRLLAAALAVTVLPVLLGSVTTASATPTALGGHRHYVALGDSYASGPGIPQQNGAPAGCGRSDHNYAALLASWQRPTEFTDVTCGGATTVHMTAAQQVAGGVNPPQFDALRRDTDLVTVTIGGNDIGFGEILGTCGRLGGDDPTGNPCQRHYTASGRDVLADRVVAVTAKITQVLAGIKARSPKATVVVVGYLRILPRSVGCWPQVPFAAGDTAYFDGIEQKLNRMLGERARAAGARWVDPYRVSAGHDACQVPERRWVEPLRPASPAAPIHPNEKGMRVVAGLTWLTTVFA